MTLGDAEVGSTVMVKKITGDGAYKRRIMDMGITKGSELYIRKLAPLGDPVEITAVSYTHLHLWAGITSDSVLKRILLSQHNTRKGT